MNCSVSCQHFRLQWDRCAAYYNVCAWVIGLRFTTNSLLWLPAEISYYGEFKERSFGIATKPVIFRSDVKRAHQAAITQHHVHCHSLLNQKVFFIFRYPLPSIFNPFPTIHFCPVPPSASRVSRNPHVHLIARGILIQRKNEIVTYRSQWGRDICSVVILSCFTTQLSIAYFMVAAWKRQHNSLVHPPPPPFHFLGLNSIPIQRKLTQTNASIRVLDT